MDTWALHSQAPKAATQVELPWLSRSVVALHRRGIALGGGAPDQRLSDRVAVRLLSNEAEHRFRGDDTPRSQAWIPTSCRAGGARTDDLTVGF